MDMKVDERLRTFECEEKDLRANSTYLLRYLRMNGIMENIGSGVTDSNGTLKIEGEYTAPNEDIHSAYPPRYELVCINTKKAENAARKESVKEVRREKKDLQKEQEDDQKDLIKDQKSDRKDLKKDQKVERKELKKEQVEDVRKRGW